MKEYLNKTLRVLAVGGMLATGSMVVNASSASAAEGCGQAQAVGPFTPDRTTTARVDASTGVAHIALWDPDKRSQFGDRMVSVIANKGDVIELANRVSGQAWVNTPECGIEDVLKGVIKYDNANLSRVITEDEASQAHLINIVTKGSGGDVNGNRIGREYMQKGQTPGLMDVPASETVEIIEVVDRGNNIVDTLEESVAGGASTSSQEGSCSSQQLAVINPDASLGEVLDASEGMIHLAEWDRQKRDPERQSKLVSLLIPKGVKVQLPANVGGVAFQYFDCSVEDVVSNVAKYDQNNNGEFVSLDEQIQKGLVTVVGIGNGSEVSDHRIGKIYSQRGGTVGLEGVPSNVNVRLIEVVDKDGKLVKYIQDVAVPIG